MAKGINVTLNFFIRITLTLLKQKQIETIPEPLTGLELATFPTYKSGCSTN